MHSCYWCDKDAGDDSAYYDDDTDWPMGWVTHTRYGFDCSPVVKSEAGFCSDACLLVWLQNGMPTPRERKALAQP